MADDPFQDLMNARIALTKKRLSLAQAIASGDDAAIKAIVEVQQALEVVDISIEELEEAELEEEAEDEDE